MARKVLNLLTNNVGLKLFSVVLAIALWLVVVNIDNPQTTVTFTGNAEIENADIITDNGKVFEVLNNSNTVKFSVTGPRTIVEGMSASDFTVVADMNKIDLDLGLIPVEVTANRYTSQVNINVKTTNVQVAIEELKTSQYVVTTQTTGTPRDGYAQGEVTCSPATVTISGPESVMEKLDKVVASIDLEDMYSDRTKTIIPVLYDSNGEKIVSDNITIEPASVTVTAEILETKSVNVDVSYNGPIKDGYTLESITAVPNAITIKGKSEALASVSSITIPASEIDLSNATGTTEISVSILQYLPEGVSLVDNDQITIVVKAEISSSATKTFDVPISQIVSKNLKNGFMIEYSTSTVKVVVKGDKETLNNLSVDDIKLTIDFSDVDTGSFKLKPTAGDIAGVTSITVPEVSGVVKTEGSSEND